MADYADNAQQAHEHLLRAVEARGWSRAVEVPTLTWESLGCWAFRSGDREHLFAADVVGTDDETVVTAVLYLLSSQVLLASWVVWMWLELDRTVPLAANRAPT